MTNSLKNQWIPVTEAMPDHGEIVAVRCQPKKGAPTWNRAYWDGKFWHGSGSFAAVTHWMRISTEIENE